MSDRRAEVREVNIGVGDAELAGDLTVPEGARALVLFAHGSGSSRHSPRNRLVALRLVDEGLATLLFDLLTPAEERQDELDGALRFDVQLLATRLLLATRWTRMASEARHLRLGYFGASTGAAAALVAAAAVPEIVGAIVSRGGRPDLAHDALDLVQAPTLLVVGGEDHLVVDLNELAYARLRCEKRLEIIPGATHLFEEPGALEKAADLAASWLRSHLVDRPAPPLARGAPPSAPPAS